VKKKTYKNKSLPKVHSIQFSERKINKYLRVLFFLHSEMENIVSQTKTGCPSDEALFTSCILSLSFAKLFQNKPIFNSNPDHFTQLHRLT
jgi:hypothetical protein